MRIAQIAPLTEAVPPKLYGGTERVVSWLTEELVRQGHDVTLFANGESKTAARLDPIWPVSLRSDPRVLDPLALHMLMLERVRQRAAEFDILHFHLDYLPFSLFLRQSTPFVTTLHGRLDLPEHQPIFTAFANAPVVAISHSQRRPVPQAGWVATIHHGLPEQMLKPSYQEPEYLAFLGRICPEKRVDRAIRIAQLCGLPIKIAAKVDRADKDYFEREIRHLFDLPNVEYIGEIDDSQKSDFLGRAMALLSPVDWVEPFGLVMIEAMACGTPVIVYDRGSAPEVVENGITGFVVKDEAEAAAAVPRARLLPRPLIRKRFEERFTARRMTADYLAVYRGLIEQEAPTRQLMRA
ncbi:MAG TPA: glycosyltransferase family 4 protein [Stellaceae bacterium]|nr:glycosyltransferase family 4 protein [Stellaceae bacterium]